MINVSLTRSLCNKIKLQLCFSCFKKMSTDLKTAKALLRTEIANRITTLTADQKKIQSEFVFQKLLQIPAFQNSSRISIFLSTEDEISTTPIIQSIFKAKKSCFVPRYNKSVMEMVRLHSMKDWEELPVTKWNIKQPRLGEERENALEGGILDLIIIPGVAFTKDGLRLGHGKGYYDTFLSKLKSRHTTIALAFREQVVEEVPTDEHDVKIDHVLFAD